MSFAVGAAGDVGDIIDVGDVGDAMGPNLERGRREHILLCLRARRECVLQRLSLIIPMSISSKWNTFNVK